MAHGYHIGYLEQLHNCKMFCWTVPLPVILSLGFLSHLDSSWLVGIVLPTLGWNFWEEYVFEAAREILGRLRAGALFRLVRGKLKFAGLMVISLERPSNTSDSGKAVWPADLRSEMAEGGIWWNRVPVSWGAEARVTGGQRDPVGLACRVGRRRCWSEGSWLTSPCPLRPACELGDCVRRTNRDSASAKSSKPGKLRGGGGGCFMGARRPLKSPKVQEAWAHWRQHQATGLRPAQAGREGGKPCSFLHPVRTPATSPWPHPPGGAKWLRNLRLGIIWRGTGPQNIL